MTERLATTTERPHRRNLKTEGQNTTWRERERDKQRQRQRETETETYHNA